MNYKKLFEESFSGVVPSKDSRAIMKSVFERTKKMEKNNVNKGVKKPFVAVAAALTTIALGVTGAAAMGLISFNEIFGGEIKTEIEDSYVLMGRAENVETYSSDEDYNVALLGVTGGNDCAIMSIEISRKDGKPVSDYFLNGNDDPSIIGFVSATCNWDNPAEGKRQSSYEWVNKDGNIMVNIEFSAEFDLDQIDNTSLAGKTITVNGDSFYPAEDFRNYIKETGAKTVFTGDSERVMSKDGTPADLSSIPSLQLEWSLGFDYYPSEKSSQKLRAGEEEINREITLIRKQRNYIDTSYPEVMEKKVEILGIEVGCTGGFVDYKEYDQDLPSLCFPEDEVYLITKDGKRINASFYNGGYAIGCGDYDISRNKLEYYSESPENGYTRLAVDVSEIAALSINGEVFELVGE